MKYECKQNDCLIEASEDKSELLISSKGDTVKLVIGLEDLNKALNLFDVKTGALDCLKQIADPINHIRKQAEAEGYEVNGMMAFALSEDANYLKGLASNFIEKHEF